VSNAYLVGGFRTPIGRRNGVLAAAHPSEMLGDLMRHTLTSLKIAPETVEQSIVGCVTTYGDQASNIGRTAWLTAGLPESTPGVTVDARCGSSQQAVHYAAGLIASGACELVICSGVEHMSRHPLGQDIGDGAGDPFSVRYRELIEAISQGEAAERIADRWGLSRADCDEIALASQQRAAQALASGRFDREIAPVTVVAEDGTSVIVSSDEGPRPSTAEGLAALKPAFRTEGVLTAGNSSQISDGASCVVIASAAWVAEHGVTPLAEIEHQVLVGVDPVLKLIGPIPASKKVLERSGLTMSDIDIVECNEAFASVIGAWQFELKADMERVNVNGGVIALGHPVGSTGARLLLTAATELSVRGADRAMVTMCCGGGLGTATIMRSVS
jgi:acetyl-CoA C-acetyltransferase